MHVNYKAKIENVDKNFNCNAWFLRNKEDNEIWHSFHSLCKRILENTVCFKILGGANNLIMLNALNPM